MTDKELIKQEIERLKEHTAKCGYPGQGEFENGNREGRNWACDKLLSFINSLPEEPASEGLEKEVHKHLLNIGATIEMYSGNVMGLDLCEDDYVDFARHFAEWQKQKDQESIKIVGESVLDEAAKEHAAKLYGEDWMKNEHVQDNGFKAISNFRFGAEWQKQQMMKGTVELTITNTSFILLPKLDIKAGDKVKIIIVKEEQQ